MRFAPIPRVAMPRATAIPRCEAVHALRSATDRVDTRIERMDEGWLTSLRMHIEFGEGIDSIDLYGLGLVRVTDHTARCEILEAGAAPGSARFDEALCLDAVESIADLLAAADRRALPGQSIEEEGSITQSTLRRRTRARRRPRIRVVRMEESARISRDIQGRATAVTRTDPTGLREDVQVYYAHQHDAQCVPTW